MPPRMARRLSRALLACAAAAAAAPSLAADADSQLAGDACIPALTYIRLDANMVGASDDGTPVLGNYERISPDGRFILRSYSGGGLGQVSLIELPATGDQPVRAYATPLSNEAFPVQGSWRYLVDISGRHYRFSDILRQGRQARPLFKGGMTGFYAVASEMKPPAAHEATDEADGPDIFIRSLSWPQGASEDAQGVGPLQLETLQVRDDGRQARVVASTGSRFICGNRRAEDGGAFALPMLSIDGTEFSAVPQAPNKGQPSTRVYELAADPMATQQPCALQADLGQTVSKAVFGYASDAAPPWVTYSDVGSVYVFDRQLQRSFRLDRARSRVIASAFPGLTRDGRVIYAATWRRCPDRSSCPQQAGYVVVDPYQNTEYRAYWQAQGKAPPKACITQQEVQQQRARFAAMHGL